MQQNKEIRNTKFSEIKDMVNSTLSKEFCAGLRARTVEMITIIRNNASTFSNVISQTIGSRRTGDQIGTLLAGAYSLVSNSEISYPDAEKWVLEQNWEEQSNINDEPDEWRCLNKILQTQLLISETGSNIYRTTTELMAIITNEQENTEDDITKKVAENTLARNGLKLKGDKLYVSNSHEGIKKILRDTPWSKKWHYVLRRLPDVKENPTTYFDKYTTNRAMEISLKVIMKNDNK